MRIGDQIHFSGLLVNYRDVRAPDYWRNTSTVRTDTGDGACEVVFVKDLQILKAETHRWYKLFRTSALALILIPLLKFALLVVVG